MTTSVLKQSILGDSPFYETQTATVYNFVSESQSNPNFCGGYQYSISSAPTAPATALSATELTIDVNTGLISLYVKNDAAVGTHTATVTVNLATYPSISRQSTFTATVTAIDPCQTNEVSVSSPPGDDYGDDRRRLISLRAC